MHRPNPTADELLVALSAGDRARLQRMGLDDLVQAYDRDYRRVEDAQAALAQDRARMRAIGVILRRKMAEAGTDRVIAVGPRGQRVALVVHADGRGFNRERVVEVASGFVKPDAGSG